MADNVTINSSSGIPEVLLKSIGLENTPGVIVRSVQFNHHGLFDGREDITADVELSFIPHQMQQYQQQKEEPKPDPGAELEKMSIPQLEQRLQQLEEEMAAVAECLLVRSVQEGLENGHKTEEVGATS